MSSREIPTVKKQHIPGLEAAYKVARNASDRDFIGFLITVARRDLQVADAMLEARKEGGGE